VSAEHPPSPVLLEDGSALRFLTVDDAASVAAAVRASLEHLRPWMPWADEQSADVAFQRDRIRRQPAIAARGEEWQYGLFGAGRPPDRPAPCLGSFGLMTRRGPGTIEIGYWVHVDHIGRGHAKRAVAALLDVAFGFEGVDQVLICCDEANARSAAIPRALGFDLTRVEDRRPEAPAESGRLMIWAMARSG
jgi:RimJ/RimL family protein N-acetyltransferase